VIVEDNIEKRVLLVLLITPSVPQYLTYLEKIFVPQYLTFSDF